MNGEIKKIKGKKYLTNQIISNKQMISENLFKTNKSSSSAIFIMPITIYNVTLLIGQKVKVYERSLSRQAAACK
ncbi:hypothetical protein DERP_009169 [Dermatophagoides pteronyssinus]|uniref:Uncharacterized protein n=1 Tax=Dermatophagoides pteronyssinus TaxID=6956 RepID=A0ABQ8JRN9_DERPT|nr:hypothetical protein DERP_009169 [Dermatophagoides pteronyssinus]